MTSFIPTAVRDVYRPGSNAGQLVGIYTAQGRINTLVDAGLDVVTSSNGVLRQVKAPQRFADIVANATGPGYTVNFYAPSQVSAGTNGQYQVSGSPYCIWTVEQPNTNSVDRVRITKRDAGQTLVYDCSYTDYTKCWVVNMGNGLKQESKSAVWDYAHVIEMDTQEVQGSGTPQSHKTVTYLQAFAWGEGVVTNIVDPNGAALTTITTYYNNSSAGGRYGQAATQVNPDGSWVTYDYDNQGRLAQEARPWKDSAMSAPANGRVRSYGYTPLDSSDVLAFNDQRPRMVTETVAGTVVGQTYYVYGSVGGQEVDTEERSAGGGYGATGNQRTTRTYYPSSDSFRAGCFKALSIRMAGWTVSTMKPGDIPAGPPRRECSMPGVATLRAKPWCMAPAPAPPEWRTRPPRTW